MNRTAKLLAPLAIATLAATGCSISINGNSHPHSSASHDTGDMMGDSASTLNSQDVMFLRGMIPHHQQAVEMSRLAPTHTKNPEVLDLAAKIQSAQQPEIDRMTQWLTDAGESTNMGGMDMGDMGLMSDEEMLALDNAKDNTFDKLFLTGMIVHHQGAVHMAQGIIANGESTQVRSLASSILTSQTSEIDQMKAMLAATK